MLKTLRGRFVLSHILPLLVLVPLMGVVLVYVLETQVLLDALSDELMGQAVLIAELLSDRPEVWLDPSRAQVFVARLDPRLDVQVMLLSANGHLLASSNPDDAGYLGQPLSLPGLSDALSGRIAVHKTYSRLSSDEMVDVLVPVISTNRRVVGVVRLGYRPVSVEASFLRLRYLIGGVLIGGLALGAIVGWVLALNMERPLRQVTRAVHRLISGEQLVPLSEKGPQEVRTLVHEVNTLVERLHSLEHARRKLLANLVHELGRPLGALQSAIQALLGGATEQASLRRELLVGMRDEVSRLRLLLDDLAGLHDQVIGTLELDRRPTDLDEWLAHTLGPWREAAQAKDLRWQATVAHPLPRLAIDPDRLGQALGNLLSNAIKYTASGGTVSVEAGLEKGMVWIRVSDTGPGIAPEDQALIFTPFYRSQLGRRFPQGMGLGLSIARELVLAHGGRLDVESTPGVGSRFTLWLPLSLAAGIRLQEVPTAPHG
jgi:two-component system sensor histidine kinase BaeS